MNPKNSKFIIAVVILALLGYFLVPKMFKNPGSELSYVTTEADRSGITSNIKATGTINPLKSVDVGTQISGTIDKIYVDYNEVVKKGDPLADIDPTQLKNELKRATADKKKTQADLSQSRSLLNTNKELHDKRLISKEEYDNSLAKYSSALALFEQASAVLETTESNLENTTVRSPIDGIVLSKNIDMGETVLPSAKPLFVISENLRKMKIETKVSEADIGKVQNSQKTFFRVDSYPAQTFQGEVTQILNEPIITNNVVTYNVIILIDNTDMKLKPGMTAEVKIVVADKKDVLRVPTSALRFIPPALAVISEQPVDDSAHSHVWILELNGQIRSVAVTAGVSDEQYTEIVDGDIKEGEIVIIGTISKGESDKNSSYLPQPRRF